MRFIRILVALSLPYVAWQLHQKATAITDDALDAPHSIANPLPPEKAGDFFGQSSRELIQQPRVKGRLFTARLLDYGALACCLITPPLLVSVFIRRRPQQEQEPCEPVEPS